MNTKHVGDITCLPLANRTFLYLATAIDITSRRLAGWALADQLRAELVVDALAAAERTRGSLTGAIIHPDHCAQHTSAAFAAACVKASVRQSMSAVGSSADNALAESFNATFKRETPYGRKSRSSEREARLDAFRWLHRYNTGRRHSRLGQRPIAFETALEEPSTSWPEPHSPCPGIELRARLGGDVRSADAGRLGSATNVRWSSDGGRQRLEPPDHCRLLQAAH
ncbi:integrase core domain-containing protein [Streptomyces sp. NBC_00885]|uniref:transposase n=1 Tax=Streptomyces sp. NBC_00885 TaxID=2975857 RepID=UPI00386E0A5A|nr:integrase core domain-containing protein [Streptomyces sp. NBC_00885]